MPKGTRVDNSISDGTKAKKWRNGNKNNKNNKKDDGTNSSLFQALNDGTKAESKIVALKLMLEFGTASQKSQAMREIQKVALAECHEGERQ